MPPQPYLPEGLYTIASTGEQAEAYYPNLNFSSEVRVRWLPDDAARAPLNNLLAHISVLELDRLVDAAATGQAFTVDPLTDLLPRPGWEIETQIAEDPQTYRLKQIDQSAIYTGLRRELLLLLELAARSAIAPHIGEPPPRAWVERLRNVHPKLIKVLGSETLFESQTSLNQSGA